MFQMGLSARWLQTVVVVDVVVAADVVVAVAVVGVVG